MPSSKELLVSVPAVGFEVFTWKPQNPELFSRAEVLRQTGNYEAAIPAEISSWSPLLSTELVSLVEDASRQVSEFDKHAQLALGAKDPALGPMSAILLRTESASSSQIERLTASAKQLALAELSEQVRNNARTVIGNVRAMEAALGLANELSENSILELHRALMTHQNNFPSEQSGAFRQEQVWLGGGNAGPRAADFIPPVHTRVASAIADLVVFLNRQDVPTLVQAAVGHAQFETIHPFIDGNGRTGRALVHSVLKSKGLTTSIALPLSAGLLNQVDGYINALTAYRKGDAGPIILEFARAAQYAAVTGRKLVDNLVDQLTQSKQRLQGVRSDATAWKILPGLISQPVINTATLKERLGLGEMAALRALKILEERGVVRELTGWRRSRVWEHPGILEVLDEYADQIKRKIPRP